MKPVTADTITDEHIRSTKCEHCDAQATCVGRYEDMKEDAFACNECCGHGCEDGHCDPIYDEDDNITENVAWADDSKGGTRMRARCAEILNARSSSTTIKD